MERLRRQAGITALSAEAPLLIAGRIGNRRVVTAVDEAASALGLRPGMTVSKAQALVPGLQIAQADPTADLASLDRLALWILQHVAPIVAPDPPDGVVIDTTGTAHLHGGEDAMMQALVGRLTLSGITARAAMADSWGAAHALARHAADPVLIARGSALLAPLPLAALRLPPTLLHGLETLGFATIADLADQSRGPLTRRFGPDLCRKLDQAMGVLPEPITPLRPKDMIEIRRAFAEPIAAPETIARYIGQLVLRLCTALETRSLGVRRMDLICWRLDSHAQTIRIGLARPRRDADRLSRLLCDRIETIDPGFGIEIMTLTATQTEPLAQRQQNHLETEAPDLSGLIDVLTNRVGARAVYRLAPVASEVPERAQCRIAPLAEPGGAGWPAHWPRPVHLLPRPEPIETLALLPDHPPAWIIWRGIRHEVRRADGPERIFGEWWRREAETHAVRDYFRIEDADGGRYWIYRAGDGEDGATGSQRWFLHGIFG